MKSPLAAERQIVRLLSDHENKMKKPRNKPVRVARLQRVRSGRRGRDRPQTDPEREERITMEVVVDAHDASERATGWFGYLENELEFPFTARCTERRAISPLLVGDEVEVVSMAPADECTREMFVMIRWEHGGLGVPLSQLEASGAGAGTAGRSFDFATTLKLVREAPPDAGIRAHVLAIRHRLDGRRRRRDVCHLSGVHR